MIQIARIRDVVKAKTAAIDRLVIDIAGRPLRCPGVAVNADDFARLQEDYNAFALVQSVSSTPCCLCFARQPHPGRFADVF
jgi:hypothetical protein